MTPEEIKADEEAHRRLLDSVRYLCRPANIGDRHMYYKDGEIISKNRAAGLDAANTAAKTREDIEAEERSRQEFNRRLRDGFGMVITD